MSVGRLICLSHPPPLSVSPPHSLSLSLPLALPLSQDMPRDEFTAEAFFKGFTEGWTAAGGDATVGSCPVPEPHFEEVEYLIDQVTTTHL